MRYIKAKKIQDSKASTTPSFFGPTISKFSVCRCSDGYESLHHQDRMLQLIVMMMAMTTWAISICGASFKVLSGNKRAIFIFNLLASSRPAQYGSINNIKYQNILLATAHTQVTLISHRCYFHGKIWEPAESLVTLATTLLMWPWWVTERDKAWQRRCEPSKGLVSQSLRSEPTLSAQSSVKPCFSMHKQGLMLFQDVLIMLNIVLVCINSVKHCFSMH